MVASDAVGSAVAQTTTLPRWRLTASARAMYSERRRSLEADVRRLLWMNGRRFGNARAVSTPATVSVTMSSIIVKPRAPRRWPADLRNVALNRVTMSAPYRGKLARIWRSVHLVPPIFETVSVFTLSLRAATPGNLAQGWVSGKQQQHFGSEPIGPGSDGHRSVVETRDFIHYRQPQPTAMPGCIRRSIEPLTHSLALSLGDAGTGILHREEGLAVLHAGARGDAAPSRRVFQRIVDQIAQQIVEQGRIGMDADRRCLDPQVDTGLQGSIEEFGDHLADDGIQVHRLVFCRDVRGGIGARQGQQLIGSVRQLSYPFLQRQQTPLDRLRGGLGRQQVQLSLHPGDRRAQLMGGVGDELLLRLRGRAQRREQAIQRDHNRSNFSRH